MRVHNRTYTHGAICEHRSTPTPVRRLAAAYAVVCHRCHPRHRCLRAHVRRTSREGRDPDRSRVDEREMDGRLPRVERVESLLGCALPARARTALDWWTNPADDVDRHADAWNVARRSATPNLPARTVAFERRP